MFPLINAQGQIIPDLESGTPRGLGKKSHFHIPSAGQFQLPLRVILLPLLYLQALEEGRGIFDVPFDVEGDHPRTARALPLHHLVLGVGRQPWNRESWENSQ